MGQSLNKARGTRNAPDGVDSGPGATETSKEIEVETNWLHLLESGELSSPTTCENLGDVGSKYDMRTDTGHFAAVLLHSLFSADECQRLVEAAELFGFGVTNYSPDMRACTRLITIDSGLAQAAFQRLRPFVPARLTNQGDEWEVVGMNECWRLAKYVQ